LIGSRLWGVFPFQPPSQARALPLPAWLTTEQSKVEASLFVYCAYYIKLQISQFDVAAHFTPGGYCIFLLIQILQILQDIANFANRYWAI